MPVQPFLHVRYKCFGELLLAYCLFNAEHCHSSHCQQHACHQHHVALMAAHKVQHHTAKSCSYNLRYADSTVKQAQISAYMVAVERIGNNGKRHGKHSCPGATYEQIGHKEHILVVNIRYRQETDAAQQQAQRIGYLMVGEARQHHCPCHTADSLHGKEYAHPVA